jgi:N-methylhydantoinase A
MGVRVGVDVGGTFTKAVAFDLATFTTVAQASRPTTHLDPNGVAAGVVEVVARLAEAVGADQVDLVVHSTTQAVNALLEGDTAPIGAIGLGRRPDLAKARKRTELANVEVAPGRFLDVRPLFVDVSDGLDEAALRSSLAELKANGARTVCVAEAFAPDDSRAEARVAELAAEEGLPACTSAELTGLYGLEMRAVTAALNASILPIAAATASYVEHGLAEAGIRAPLMVMRGDAGATDMEGFRHYPARTLYSGPAASVAGALGFTGANNTVVVEVGGTSTNVAAIRDHRPALSYVRVASHATALRSVDVRVIGVAGGSMLRVRRRRVYGVGPRSAHIAGLAYAAYAPAGTFTGDGARTGSGARAIEFAPVPGDPADYLAVESASGVRYALTNTCAAVALGIPEPGDYAATDPAEAVAAFAVAGAHLRLDGQEVARRMLEASGTAVCDLVAAVAADRNMPLAAVSIMAVGGGAGGLGRHVATMLGAQCTVPAGAEVISSIGDALSLVRAERERTADAIDATLIEALTTEAEAEAVGAGADPATIDVRVDEQPEKGTVRAVATGAVVLPGTHSLRQLVDDEEGARRAEVAGGEPVRVATFWVGRPAGDAPGRAVAVDRWGDIVVDTEGEVLVDPDAATIEAVVERRSAHRRPAGRQIAVWVLQGHRIAEISSQFPGRAAAELVAAADATAASPRAVVIVGLR